MNQQKLPTKRKRPSYQVATYFLSQMIRDRTLTREQLQGHLRFMLCDIEYELGLLDHAAWLEAYDADTKEYIEAANAILDYRPWDPSLDSLKGKIAKLVDREPKRELTRADIEKAAKAESDAIWNQ